LPIITTRTSENAKISIDASLCVNCGICAAVCVNESMTLVDGRLRLNENTVLGCFGCGQCVAVCPKDAITVEGRFLSKSDFAPLEKSEKQIDFAAFKNVAAARRSIRAFKAGTPVGREAIAKIIECAAFAPPSVTPSDVEALVVEGEAKVRDFAFDLLEGFKKRKFLISKNLFKWFKPFMSKYKYDNFMTFLIPWMNILGEKHEKGLDWLFYGAPAVVFFYGSQESMAVDVTIAATYAMLAAEALGLGTCMIGSVAPLLSMGGAALRKKYRITSEVKAGIAIIVGHPKYKYGKSIKRSFKSLRYY